VESPRPGLACRRPAIPGAPMYRKHGEPPTSGTSKIANAEPAPDDGQIGEWPRKRLVEMDKRFSGSRDG
jgi:hypothetical protein